MVDLSADFNKLIYLKKKTCMVGHRAPQVYMYKAFINKINKNHLWEEGNVTDLSEGCQSMR